MWAHIKMGELSWPNALGFLHLGRSLKIHVEIKRGVVSKPKKAANCLGK
jgi:hypothetical protein